VQTSSENIVLYGDHRGVSPYVFSVYVALREKGLPFELRIVDLDRGDQDAGDYANHSLTARVPAITHGDFGLAESSAIVEYLEDVFPPPKHPRVLPEGVRERARARQVMAWIRSDLVALRDERPTTTIFFEQTRSPLSPGGEAAARKLIRVAETLVGDGRANIFGDYTVVDSDLTLMLHRLLANGEEVPAKVRAYASAQWKRPSVQEFVSQDRPARPSIF